ncbi:MAG: nucleotidyltransferase family protein [Polynucleobacter sp.]
MNSIIIILIMTDTKSIHSLPLRLAVLLLAAGQGSRLGSHPKALLKQGGVTLLKGLLNAVEPFNPVELIAVIGFHGDAIEQALVQMNSPFSRSIQLLRNPTPEVGQASSVRLGIEALHSNFDVLLIALSDQPAITTAEVSQLLSAFSQRSTGTEMLLPMVQGQRGNPVLFSKKALQNTLAIPDLSCRAYMDAHPEQVQVWHTDNDAFVCDVDTPQDMKRYQLDF